MYLSDILSESCEWGKRKCDNSIQITWAYHEMANRSPSAMSPAAMFQAWQADLLVRYTTREWWVWKKEVYNSTQITWAYQKKSFWGGEPRSPAAMLQAWLGRGGEHCSPAAMFQAWQASVPIRYTIWQLSMLKMECYCIENALCNVETSRTSSGALWG